MSTKRGTISVLVTFLGYGGRCRTYAASDSLPMRRGPKTVRLGLLLLIVSLFSVSGCDDGDGEIRAPIESQPLAAPTPGEGPAFQAPARLEPLLGKPQSGEEIRAND